MHSPPDDNFQPCWPADPNRTDNNGEDAERVHCKQDVVGPPDACAHELSCRQAAKQVEKGRQVAEQVDDGVFVIHVQGCDKTKGAIKTTRSGKRCQTVQGGWLVGTGEGEELF